MPTSEARLLGSVQRLAAALARLERLAAAREGVTVSQMRVLIYLAHEAPAIGVTMGSLAEQQGLAISTMTRNISLLERKGWLQRVGGTIDRRTVLVTLSAAGEGLAERLEESVRHQFARAFRHFHPSDRVERAVAVGRVAAALEEHAPPAAAAPDGVGSSEQHRHRQPQLRH